MKETFMLSVGGISREKKESYILFCWIPRSHRTASFLYRLSPRELMRIAGSLPLLPHRFIVRGETRKTFGTSFTVRRSGRLLSDSD